MPSVLPREEAARRPWPSTAGKTVGVRRLRDRGRAAVAAVPGAKSPADKAALAAPDSRPLGMLDGSAGSTRRGMVMLGAPMRSTIGTLRRPHRQKGHEPTRPAMIAPR